MVLGGMYMKKSLVLLLSLCLVVGTGGLLVSSGDAEGAAPETVRTAAGTMSGTAVPDENQPSAAVGCTARVIRASEWMETGGTPAVTVVRSRAELSGYIGGIQDAGRQDGLPESGLAEAAAGYDDAWFASHILVLALFDEPSGSIRHEVEGVDADGNIRIARIYSDVMMCDMASHYLLLELDREYDDRPFTLRFTQRLEEA